MHLALIEAMYKSKLIGSFGPGSQNIKVGNQFGQGNEEPQYFVVGVEKDEWDIKGKYTDCIRWSCSLTIFILTILVLKVSFHFCSLTDPSKYLHGIFASPNSSKEAPPTPILKGNDVKYE